MSVSFEECDGRIDEDCHDFEKVSFGTGCEKCEEELAGSYKIQLTQFNPHFKDIWMKGKTKDKDPGQDILMIWDLLQGNSFDVAEDLLEDIIKNPLMGLPEDLKAAWKKDEEAGMKVPLPPAKDRAEFIKLYIDKEYEKLQQGR